MISPVLRGWVNYFWVVDSDRCFSMVEHLGREEDPAATNACQRTRAHGLEAVE